MFDFDFESSDSPFAPLTTDALLLTYSQNPDSITDAELLERIAVWYLEHENPHEALVAIKQLLHHFPTSTSGWFLKGLSLNALQRLEEARDAFRQHLLYNPLDADTMVQIGQTYEQTGFPSEALVTYETALAADAFHVEARFRLGWLLEKMNRYEDAIRHLKTCVQYQPEHEEAWHELGFCYEMLEKEACALYCYEQQLNINPYAHLTWYNRGIVLSRMGRFEEALKSYDFTTVIQETFSAAWYNRGNILARLSRFQEAIDCYKKALQADPKDAATLYNMALAYRQIGDLDAFSLHWQKAARINPNLLRQR